MSSDPILEVKRRMKKFQEAFQNAGYIIKIDEKNLRIIFDVDTLYSIVRDYVPSDSKIVRLIKTNNSVILQFDVDRLMRVVVK